MRTERALVVSERPVADRFNHSCWRVRASRGEDGKLVTNLVLHGKVEADPAKKYSPEQIAGRLKVDFPDQREMQVSTETIYQTLYVQPGALASAAARGLA